MKKFVKGFTLIELIIVMAILSILTLAMAQMFKPIRETYVDATLIESRRSAQTGITKYITESIRFSTDLGLYTNGNVSGIKGAVDAFADAYIDPSDPKKTEKVKVIEQYAEVIVVDKEKDYNFNGDDYKGRLIRRKFVNGAGGVPEQISNDYEDITNADKCRLALGAGYYGGSNYTINLTVGGTASDGIKVTVASTARYGLRDVGDDTIGDDSVVSTPAFVICKNQSEAGGMFDTSKYVNVGDPAYSNEKSVYIVWLDGDAKDKVDATP